MTGKLKLFDKLRTLDVSAVHNHFMGHSPFRAEEGLAAHTQWA